MNRDRIPIITDRELTDEERARLEMPRLPEVLRGDDLDLAAPVEAETLDLSQPGVEVAEVAEAEAEAIYAEEEASFLDLVARRPLDALLSMVETVGRAFPTWSIEVQACPPAELVDTVAQMPGATEVELDGYRSAQVQCGSALLVVSTVDADGNQVQAGRQLAAEINAHGPTADAVHRVILAASIQEVFAEVRAEQLGHLPVDRIERIAESLEAATLNFDAEALDWLNRSQIRLSELHEANVIAGSGLWPDSKRLRVLRGLTTDSSAGNGHVTVTFLPPAIAS